MKIIISSVIMNVFSVWKSWFISSRISSVFSVVIIVFYSSGRLNSSFSVIVVLIILVRL